MELPYLSIITVALNCADILEDCYTSIANQDYPKDRIEMLLIDGGSTDNTPEVAERFGAMVINGGYRENQEARRYIGFLNASHEILVYLDSDNLITEQDWLKKMVRPFLEDEEIVGTQTLKYSYDKRQSLMNRYFALLGANDPVAYYLGKADRLPWFHEDWNLRGDIIYEEEEYYKVRFNIESFPTIGCNGFLVRRSAFEKLKCDAEEFLHIDANYDLIEMGFDTYGIVKNSILHSTGDTLLKSIKKRMTYMGVHHQDLKRKRRYKVFDLSKTSDIMNLLKFMIFSCTVVKPIYDSIRGFIRIRDLAWFVHPFVCMGFVFAYSYATVIYTFSSKNAQ